MKACFMVVCALLVLVMGGCGGWKSSKKIVATSTDDMVRQANRACPYGYDFLGVPEVFVEGKENTRYIRCRMMQ
ncbi:MAG TPA: hypothetical protein VI389_08110 [Geobacteraceae bacterium]